MIAFDTNHLLRHVLDDDPKQCKRVRSLIDAVNEANQQICLLDLVIMETCWVLQSVMGFDRDGWSHVLEQLLLDPAFRFDDAGRLWKALDRYRAGKADFDDYLILGQAEAMGATLETFDKKLKKEL